MGSMTFLINDSSTGGSTPVVQIVITENADGTVTFTVTQLAGYVGDLRGLFFDIADESLIGSLSASSAANLTEFQQGNDTVSDLGNGANMQGLLGDAGGYDVGVEIGSSGLKTTDDVRTFTFTLDSSARDLTLADFSNVCFGARITSVGLDSNLDGTFETSRSGSSKTGEVTFAVITPTKDEASVFEDATASGNVLANDGAGAGDVLSVTGWSGGAVGVEYTFVDLANAKIKLDANGSYTIDASDADSLAAGESVSHTFTYNVLQTNVDGTTTHTVSFKVTITGTNDAPVIAGEVFTGGVTEAGSNVDTGTLSTSSSFSFDDIDVTDTHTVTFSPVGSTLGTLSALSISDPATGAGDGTVSWTYGVNAADAAYLAEGETRVEEFTVTVTDVNGLSDNATVRVTIAGTNDAPVIAGDLFTGGVTEAGSNVDTGTLTTSSTFAFDDADLTDAHSVGFTPVGTTLGTLSTLSITDPATGLGDGTVSFTYSVNAADVAYLAEGETRVEEFTVTVTDDAGTPLSDSATVRITITGTNDAPVIAGTLFDAGVTEAGSNADTGTLTTSDSFSFDDADLTDAHTVGFTPVGTTFGTLSALSITDAATGAGDGTVSYTYSVNAADVAYLAEGETRVEEFTVTVTDDAGTPLSDSATVRITITGTNDAPVIAGTLFDAGVTEAGSNADTGTLTTSDSFSFDDADLTDAHTVGFTPVGTTFGTLSALSITDPATGAGDGTVSYTYSVNAADVAYLAEGETRVEEFTVTVTDDAGTPLSDSATVRITITGTNDAPVIAGTLFDAGVNEAGSNVDTGTLTTSDSFSFDDADLTDAHTVGFTPVGMTFGTLSALSISDAATGLGDGTVSFTYSVNEADVAYLAEGETRVEEFTVTVTDDAGTPLSDSATVRITITGTNDAPVIAGTLFDAGVTEAGSNVDTGTLTTSDSFSFDDADLTDAHTVGFTPVGMTFGTLSALSITDAATGAGDGTVSYTYSVNAADVAYLAEGETRIEEFTVTVTDDAGTPLSDSATVRITITGTNDAPVIAGTLFNAGVTEAGSNADTGILTTSDSFSFDDADLTDAHTVGFTPVGTTFGTLSTLTISDPATDAGDGTVSYTYSVNAADVAYLAEGETRVEEFTVTVTDDAGTPLSDSATVRITITGSNDAPIVAAIDVTGGVTELTTPAGDLTDTGTIAFSDVDLLDVHSVGPVTPSAGALGALTASVTTQASDVNGTGGVITWNYSVAASAVEFLAAGETKIETFTFDLSDGQGGNVARTVSVTITGTNDAPDLRIVTTDGAAATLTETNAGLTASDTLTVTDVDTTDVIGSAVSSVVASGATAGLGLTNAQLLAMMTVAPTSGLPADSGDAHNLTWTFDSGAQAFNYLNSGESLVLNYSISSSDGHGGDDTQQVTVTINGSADGPTDIVLTGFTPGQTNVPAGSLGQFSAVGAAGAVTFSATLVEKDLAGTTQSDATADITVSSSGLVSGVTGPNGIQEGRIYELNTTATDGGGSLTQLFRVVTGTTGGETINLGSTPDDLVFLAAGNDTIFSGSGDDTVYGQSGTDLIHGGDGNDYLDGMNGTDTFFFDTPLNATTNVDTINDFNAQNGNPNADTVFLSTSVFAGIGSGSGTLAAADYASVNTSGSGDVSALSVGASVNIVFDSSTGGLFYDANGGSLADATKFAVVDVVAGTFDNGDIKFGP